jgi:integrase
VQKPPSLRNNNGSLQVRVRIDGRDAFINRLGRWSDPVAVAKAHAIAAQIWSDYQQGVFDRSLMAYQPLINGKEVGLLDALRVRAETKRQAAAIHAYRLLQRYGKPIRNRSDAEGFLGWLRAPPLPAKLTPLHFDHQGGLMEQSYASLQRGRQG